MNRSWIAVVGLLTSCSTFGDLEGDHPFDQACEPGFVKNEAGECIPNPQNNLSNEPNNVSNEPNNVSNEPNNVSNVPNNIPCEAQPGTCCELPEGVYCCTPDGCCSFDASECEPPPNNTNNPPNSNPFLSDYMLVIADANPQECEDQGWDGPDIFGVRAEFDNAELFPYLASFQEGSNAMFAEDIAAAVIEGGDPNNPECSMGPSFSLGCGGWVGIGFQADDQVDVTASGRLTILESGPQCDQVDDLYMILVCPMGDPDVPFGDCLPISDGTQGNFNEDVQLF